MKHLSYRQFKNIFGDLGVTAWTKFNWLSNGLPDGTYNGLTKVTISDLSSLNPSITDNYRVYFNYGYMIPPPSNDEAWSYGFSNYKTYGVNALGLLNETGIAYSTGQNLSIKVKGLTTIEAVNNYLKKHPLIIYYYDRNDWEGVSYNFSSAFNGGVRLYQSGRFFVNFHLCDWRYVSLGYHKSPTDFPKPKAFTFFYYGAKETSAANLCVYPYDHAITDLSEVEQERLKEPVYFVFKK